MFRRSSLILRRYITRPQFKFCVKRSEEDPDSKSTEIPYDDEPNQNHLIKEISIHSQQPNSSEEQYHTNPDENSLFEQIAPESLSKDILKSLLSAKDIEQVLQIYGKNKLKINERNIGLFIRSISSRQHTIHKENSQTIKNNYYYKDMVQYIKSNVHLFNAPTLTDLLTYIRKLKNYRSLDDFPHKEQARIFSLLDSMLMEKKVNPKFCCQIFYEYAILRGDSTIPFLALKEAISDPNLKSYITPYASIFIFKGIAQLKSDRRKYLDFAYKVAIHIESGVETLNTYQLCSLFNNIAFLRLNTLTSHKRFPQIFWKLQTLIEKNKHSLNEEEVIEVLEGYAHGPSTLDSKLVLYIKDSVLLTISEKPLNLSLNFLVNFIQSMSKQKEGIQLSKESLQMIEKELIKRYEVTRNIKLNTVCSTVKAFLDHKYKAEKLYALIYSRLLQLPEKDYTLNLCVNLATYLLKQNFRVDEFLERLFTKFENEIPERQIEGVFKVFFVYSHPNTPNTEFFKKANEFIFNILLKQCETSPKPALRILGTFFVNAKGEHVNKLHSWALKEIQKQWSDLDIYQKSNYALTFINVRTSYDWTDFLSKAFQDLKEDELAALLTTYERQEDKSYFTSDFIFKTIIQSPNRQKVLKKILDVIISTPPNVIMTKQGTVTDEVRKLFEVLLSEPLQLNDEIRPVDLLKFHRNIKQYRTDPTFSYVLLVRYLEETNFLENNQTNHFTLAEMSDILVELAENLKTTNRETQEIYDKAISILQEMQGIFNTYLENQEVQAISLNLYVRLLNNIVFFYKRDVTKKDPVFTGHLMNNLYHKIKNVNHSQHHGTVLNAIFLVMEADLCGFYTYDDARTEAILDIFQKCADSTSPITFVNYFTFFTKHSKNLKFRILWKYLTIIQNLYMNSSVQIYPYIINDYLQLFSQLGTRDPHFYNKVLKDIEKVFEDIKPKYLIEMSVTLSNLRMKHNTFFEEIAKKVMSGFPKFRKSLIVLIWSFAKLGFTETWCQDFIFQSIKYLEESEYEFNNSPARAIELLWSMAALDITNSTLMPKLHSIFEQYSKTDDWLKNDITKVIMNNLYLLYQNHHPGFEITLSDEVVDKFEETRLKRLVTVKEVGEVCEILEEMGVEYEKNKYVDDVLIADVFLPNQSFALFYLSDLYVTFNGTEETGFQKMRSKVLKHYGNEFGFTHLFDYHWKKLESQNDKIEYLKKLGVKSEFAVSNEEKSIRVTTFLFNQRQME